jgi:hypothetical protein
MYSKYNPYPRSENCKRWLTRFQGLYNYSIPNHILEAVRHRVIDLNELSIKISLEKMGHPEFHIYSHNILSILSESPPPLPRLNWDEIYSIIYECDQQNAITGLQILHIAKIVLDNRKNNPSKIVRKSI